MVEYFECSCHSPEHTLKFMFEEFSSDSEIAVSVFLAELPWHKRLFVALKYAMGYKCRYGHFEEFLLDKEDCDRIIEIVGRLKNSS